MTAYVDLSTGKIYGCKRGSWEWWHEKGHIEFNRDEKAGKIKLWQNYVFIIWMFSITLSILNRYMIFISFPSVIIYIVIEVYEEKWCNDYADKKTKSLKPKYI